MAFRYTGRQGETFYLHARQEERDDDRTELVHYFASELNPDEAVDALPAGYSVAEQPGGVRLVRSATAERHQERLRTMADPRARREAKRAARRARFEARTRPARVDWMALALAVGLDPDGGSPGDDAARRVVEEILGEENIRTAVLVRLGLEPGWNIAEAVLKLIRSEQATDLAYAEYTAAGGQQAVEAVRLIKEIGHPKALDWAESLLRDERVAREAIGLVAALVSHDDGDPSDARVERTLALADAHPSEAVRDEAARIRGHLAARARQGGREGP